jgi:hypothetical protein
MRYGGLSIKIIFWSCFNGMTFCLHHVLNFKILLLNISASGKFTIFEINLLKHCTTCINRSDCFSEHVLWSTTFQQHLHMEYISLSWYSTVWFHWCRVRLTRNLLNQGFQVVMLKSSHRKFYSHHHDLVNRYGVSVSQITTDMFRSS